MILNLQRAIQSAIDIAAHIIKGENLPLPSALRDYFLLLGEKDYLSTDLADRLARMVGFRNLVVHEYHKIDLGIVKAICKTHLSDFSLFIEQMSKVFQIKCD